MAATVGLALGLSVTPSTAQPGGEARRRVSAGLPGAPAFSSTVRERLEAALAGRPATYEPRTRNLRPDGSPAFTNRLLLEASPYLQQHAHNPVNWYPWGDEAFEAARRLDRPVLVSIGYSTCHWCHVMEEESFDDVATAAYMNEHVIAIKVDREARPDVDAIYMAAVHAMRQRGGWPLNVWMTPDRKPFFGGTYFPRDARGGHPSFMDVLRGIEREYAANRGRIDEISEELSAAIRANLEGTRAGASQALGVEVLQRAFSQTLPRVDRTWGGIGHRTKFPSNTPFRFLLRYYHRSGDTEALRLATITLEKMAEGGIHDHVGGGFHRYSTDPKWLVPHFEKMLYDNALLATIYLEAGQLTGRSDFLEICRRILDYVALEMTAPGGAFYSATDADSLSAKGEPEEGWFFTWTPSEIESALGAKSESSRAVAAYYGVTAAGDYEGRNILHVWREREDIARELQTTPADLDGVLAKARQKLYLVRARRTPPLLDDKVLVAWNGLMISAFARAGLALDEPRYIAQAERAAHFVLAEMRTAERLLRVYLAGRAEGPAFLQDYAFFIAGLLDLYEVSGERRWLREALALQTTLDSGYADDDAGGYYQTAADHEPLLAREKPGHDGAIPSGNSVAAFNLLRLAELTGEVGYHERALGIFSSFDAPFSNNPLAFSEMLVALDFLLSERVEVVLLSPAGGRGLDAMLKPVRATFLPNRVLTVAREDEALADHAQLNPLLRGRFARNGTTTAYLCKDRVCGYPTEDPATFAKQLREAARASVETQAPPERWGSGRGPRGGEVVDPSSASVYKGWRIRPQGRVAFDKKGR